MLKLHPLNLKDVCRSYVVKTTLPKSVYLFCHLDIMFRINWPNILHVQLWIVCQKLRVFICFVGYFFPNNLKVCTHIPNDKTGLLKLSEFHSNPYIKISPINRKITKVQSCQFKPKFGWIFQHKLPQKRLSISNLTQSSPNPGQPTRSHIEPIGKLIRSRTGEKQSGNSWDDYWVVTIYKGLKSTKI